MILPKKIDVLIAAFCGGTALSWLELLRILIHNPQDLNIYFFAGMFVAGIIGLGVSFFIKGDTARDSAFFTGIAAPQLLGATISAGTTITSIAFHFSLISLAYAQPPDTIVTDSTKIEITVKGTNEPIIIQDMNTEQKYVIEPDESLEIPYSNSLEIKSHNAENKKVKINKDYIIDNKKKLDVVIIPKHRTRSIFRGLFAQQHVAHENFTKKITVKEIQQKEKPESLLETEITDSTDNNE